MTFQSKDRNKEAVNVLEDINLEVGDGEFVCIVGPSGCGKSTLLNIAGGFLGATRGEIRIDGEKVTEPNPRHIFIFQENSVFPWLTVEDNVRVGLLNAPGSPSAKDKSVQEHIELVGLKGFENAYPHQLSGGMSQRVAIARALVNRPEVLLLDEPFGALDALTRTRLQQELQRIWQTEGITAILVTHDVEEAVYLGDRVVVMQPRPGRIQRIVDVPLARPRDRVDPAFTAIKDDVLSEFSHEINHATVAERLARTSNPLAA